MEADRVKHETRSSPPEPALFLLSQPCRSIVIETDVHVGMALQDAGWTLLGDRTVKRLRDGCCLVCPCRDQLDTGGPHDRRQAPRQRFAGHHTMRGEEPRIGPSGGFGQGGPMGGGYKCRSRFVEPDVPVLPNPKHLQVDTFAGQDSFIRRGGLLRTPDCAATLAGMAAGTHVVLELAGGDESALSRLLLRGEGWAWRVSITIATPKSTPSATAW
jgi:hypothetical protein